MLSEKSSHPIYKFESAGSWLKFEFDRKKARNEKYSIRSFAKSLDVSYSSLARLFQNKTKLSKENISHISEKLKLDHLEKTYFEKIAHNQVNVAAIDHLRMQATSQIKSVEDISPVFSINAFAILQMIEVDTKVKFSVKRAASKLSITLAEVRFILDKLQKQNLVKILNKNYICTQERLLIQSKESTTALKNYYQATFKRASESLEEHDANERYIGTETIALDESSIPEAQKIIDEALDRISALSQKSKIPSDIYQCSTVFFRVTQKDPT